MLDGRRVNNPNSAIDRLGGRLGKIGIKPNALTLFGLMMAVAAAFAVGTGHLGWALLVGALSTLPDLFDGAVARATNSASTRGAFFDSVADRISDSLFILGIAWYLQSRDGGHISMLAMAVLVTSWLIPYLRSKAESLGFDGKGGIMERAERLVLLSIGIAIPSIMIAVLWVVLALSLVTAGQRFYKIWKQTSPDIVPRRRILVMERWEEWRAQYLETAQARKEARFERRAERKEERTRRRAARSDG